MRAEGRQVKHSCGIEKRYYDTAAISRQVSPPLREKCGELVSASRWKLATPLHRFRSTTCHSRCIT